MFMMACSNTQYILNTLNFLLNLRKILFQLHIFLFYV